MARRRVLAESVGLLLILMIVGGAWWISRRQPLEAQPVMTVYFADSEAMYLVPHEIPLDPASDPPGPEAVIEALLAGPPPGSGLMATFPQGVELLGVARDGDLLIADFSRSLVERHGGGSTGEGMTIYSLVNSLAELDGVERVAIRIEGEIIESLAGHYDLREPYHPRADWIRPAP